MTTHKGSQYLSKGVKRTALSVALGMCFVGGVYAQSNTSGAITGHAAAGETITITNPGTGFTRTTTAGADGSYRFSALPTGQYTITSTKGGSRTVSVNVGTASSVDFATGGGDATTLDAVTVVGSGLVNPIDVSSVESTTILTAEQINKIPVAHDTTSVALLAPGTVKGDAAFGNLASFGGSSVAENQYYVNGFNVTNTFRNLNFSQVPFEAIAEQQVKTGGYGAEFGRSLGGVVNQITRRGTNEFHAGGNIRYTPESLTEQTPNTYYSNPLSPSTYGQLRQDNSKDTQSQYTVNAWASGALIKDKLFAYGLVSYGYQENDTWGSVVSATNNHVEEKSPTWLLKMDWNITDNHLLELTAFSDRQKTYSDTYGNTPRQLDRTSLIGKSYNEQGGDNYILKYTGYLTDSFTLSALAGHGKFSRAVYLTTPDGRRVSYDGNIAAPAQPGCPVVADSRTATQIAATGLYSSHCNITGGTIDRKDSGDTRKQYRLDAEWQLGDHRIRFGYDRDDYESVAGVALEGGYQWTYLNDGVTVQKQYFSQGTTVELKQFAYYVDDSWSITDNFIAYFGGRWDTFQNFNGDGDKYVEIKNQFGPRLGFSWDVNGDSSFKVFGNAGRYALPLTPSVAVRGASASLFSRETFSYTGVDPVTGEPLGTVSNDDFFYLNGEDGHSKNPATIASKDLKPMYQDEFILGFQAQLTDHFSLGARGIYRNLKQAIDDNCDYAAVLGAAGFHYDDDLEGWTRGDHDAQGNERLAALPSSGLPYCRMFNPGADAVFVSDFYNDGTMEETKVKGSVLSPKAKRRYTALELFFEGNYDKLSFQGSYTYGRSIGNTEGGVKSDIGQADTSVTQDFDYIELTKDTYGYLPNDRRHSFKLFGSYKLNDEWLFGANALIQSGRPLNCLGVLDLNPALPIDRNGDGDFEDTSTTIPAAQRDVKNYRPHAYGSSFMRCGTTVNGGVDDAHVKAFPRGTKGRLPWTTQLDVGVTYTPNWAKGLMLKMEVNNLLKSEKVTSVNETAEVRATGLPSQTYLLPASFQPARSVRFIVQYDF